MPKEPTREVAKEKAPEAEAEPEPPPARREPPARTARARPLWEPRSYTGKPWRDE